MHSHQNYSFWVACKFYSLVVIFWNRVEHLSDIYFVQRSIQTLGLSYGMKHFVMLISFSSFLLLFWTTFYFFELYYKEEMGSFSWRELPSDTSCRKEAVLNQIHWDPVIRSSYMSLGPVLQNVILKVRFHSAWVEFLNQENMSKDSL